MIFISRRRRGPGRFDGLKVQLFFAGAVVLLAGMALERDALVGFAVAILAAGFALRFLEREEEPPGADAADAEEFDADEKDEEVRDEAPRDGPHDHRA